MTAPRVEVDLDAIEDNTRVLVDRLATRGIRVTAVTKAALGSPAVAAAMLRGGATGLGDSRVENLARLDAAGLVAARTLIRSPMISQVDAVVRHASTSLNTEKSVLEALSLASSRLGTTHAVVLMVELGDLREGVLPADLVALEILYRFFVEVHPTLTLFSDGRIKLDGRGFSRVEAGIIQQYALTERVTLRKGSLIEIGRVRA